LFYSLGTGPAEPDTRIYTVKDPLGFDPDRILPPEISKIDLEVLKRLGLNFIVISMSGYK
jgi:hypothetical protein